MAETALFDPVVVEPELSPLKVRELLTLGRESAKLDFKRGYDPSSTAEKVEIVKDLVAMANTAGGYIVVGVADDGTLIGLSHADSQVIDEATVRAQVAGYTAASIPLFVDNKVEDDGKRYVVITVLPVAGTIAVMETVGNRPGKGAAFRAGDVLVRHGSASEVWNQADVDFLLRRALEHRKELWLGELRRDLGRLFPLSSGEAAPITAAVFDESAEDFQGTVVELMRRADG